MHSIYGITIIYIISSILPLISTAPIIEKSPNKSIYEFLVDHSTSKCSYLKTTKLLEPKPTFLSRCSNYALLKSFKSLTYETQYDLLCVLYSNNYLRLCDSLGNSSKVVNDMIINDLAKSYNFSSTCQALSESKLNNDFKGAENVLGKLKNPKICEFLCKELLDDSVIPICNLAAVFLNITGQIPIGPLMPPKSQGLQKDALKVDQEKDNNVVHEDVSSVVKLDIAEKTGIIESGQPMNDKNVENKVQLAKKPKVSQPAVNSQELTNSHVKSGEKSPELHSNAQGPQPHVDNLVNAGDDTSVKANKAPTADVVEKTEIQEEKPVAVTSILKTDADKQENQHGEQQDKVIQTPSDTQKSPVEQAQKDQKELITTSTEGIPAAVQDRKFIENDLGIDVRDPNQSNNLLNMEEDGDDDDTAQQEPQKPVDKVKPQAKPQETDEDVLNPQFNSNSDEEDSFFFIYFMMVCAVFILGYIGYHNKQKVLALVIEGRRGRRGSRRGRPNSANYHKLDSNLEEAVTSSCNKNTTNIIY